MYFAKVYVNTSQLYTNKLIVFVLYAAYILYYLLELSIIGG